MGQRCVFLGQLWTFPADFVATKPSVFKLNLWTFPFSRNRVFKRHLRTFPAEFVANKIGYISRDVGPSSSMNVATKILDFKPNLDAFQTLTKCFLCLRKKAEKTTNTAV